MDYSCSVEDTEHSHDAPYPPVIGYLDEKKPQPAKEEEKKVVVVVNGDKKPIVEGDVEVEKKPVAEDGKEAANEDAKKENPEAEGDKKDPKRHEEVKIDPNAILLDDELPDEVFELGGDDDFKNLLKLCSKHSVNEDILEPTQDSLLMLRL